MPTRSLVTLLLACLATWAAVAAPAPDPSRWVTGWEAVDPDKDCKFVRAGGVLTIAVPGGGHQLTDYETPPVRNAPRLVRPVAGNFVAQVRVRGDFDPRAAPGKIARVSAGLALLLDGGNYVWLARHSAKVDDARSGVCAALVWADGFGVVPRQHIGSDLTGVETYLRLERAGNHIRACFSEDGRRWEELVSRRVPLPAELKLGVFAASTSAAPFSPRFDRFTLTMTGRP